MDVEKPRLQKGVVEAGGKTQTIGFAGLLSEVHRSAYRTLGWTAGVVGALSVFELVRWFFDGHVAGPAWSDVLVATASAVVFWLCRAQTLPPSRFATTALAFEIFVGLNLGTHVLNWQNLLGEQGWPLGGSPAVAIWVIFFANIVPLPPARHLLGAVLSVLSLPVCFFLSLSLYEVPAEVDAERNLLVFGQLMLPAVLGVVIAYVSARRVFGLSLDLSEARRLGNYQLSERLGEGGMGEVWKAQHHMLVRPAAVKLIRSTGGGGAPIELLLERFEREVQATAELSSPHTIEVYDYGRNEDGTFYYVMELLDGLDLHKLVNKYGPQPVERVVHILRQACHSLGEAHENGMVHRDIKPANIYLCHYGRDFDFVKILDFGMVKQSLGSASGLTQFGTFAGTAHYAAPEMAEGLIDKIDGRSDIYALGCVAFWLLTGRPVFEAETVMKLLVKHIHDEPAPPSRFATGVPAELDRLILDCLEKDLEKRVGSADELDARLASVPTMVPWTSTLARAWWEHNRPGKK